MPLAPENAQKAWEMRLRGLPWDRIAAQFDTTISEIKAACLDAAEAEHTDEIAELRSEIARLDRLQAAIWNGALKGDPQAVAQVRGIITDRENLKTALRHATARRI